MSNQIPIEAKSDPTYKKYYLNCKIKFFKKTVRETLPSGQTKSYDRKLVLLVPQESDETIRFYNAWVPQTQKEHFELAVVMGSLINSFARVSVHLGHDEKCDRPYLFMMTYGVEEIIHKFGKEGQILQVTTLPANEDAEADNAPDSNHNFNPFGG